MKTGKFVFVHGTGVRASGYERSLRLVSLGLNRLGGDPPWEPVACLWSGGLRENEDEMGSILPDAPRADTVGQRNSEDEAMWSLLLADPGIEIRIAFDRSGEEVRAESRVHQQVMSLEAAEWFSGLTPEEQECLLGGRDELVRHPAYVTLTHRVEPVGELFGFAARAWAALAASVARYRLVATEASNSVEGPVTDEEIEGLLALHRISGLAGARDLAASIYSAIYEGDLGGAVGILGTAKAAAMRLASGAASFLLEKYRYDISFSLHRVVGDILRYQRDGEGLRKHVGEAIESGGDEPLVLAHSLGAVIAVDAIAAGAGRRPRLVTFGCPVGFFAHHGALAATSAAGDTPIDVHSWLNVYDPRDYIAFKIGGTVGAKVAGRITEHELANDCNALEAHIRYVESSGFWDVVGSWLRG